MSYRDKLKTEHGLPAPRDQPVEGLHRPQPPAMVTPGYYQEQWHGRPDDPVALQPRLAQEPAERGEGEEPQVRPVQNPAVGVLESAKQKKVEAHPQMRHIGHRNNHLTFRSQAAIESGEH